MGTISYPHTGMGIVAGIIFFRGYGYGIELPGGYIPVAMPILDRHHMAATCAFLNVTLCRLEHAAQLIQALLSPVHVVVQDEVPIAWR